MLLNACKTWYATIRMCYYARSFKYISKNFQLCRYWPLLFNSCFRFSTSFTLLCCSCGMLFLKTWIDGDKFHRLALAINLFHLCAKWILIDVNYRALCPRSTIFIINYYYFIIFSLMYLRDYASSMIAHWKSLSFSVVQTNRMALLLFICEHLLDSAKSIPCAC